MINIDGISWDEPWLRRFAIILYPIARRREIPSFPETIRNFWRWKRTSKTGRRSSLTKPRQQKNAVRGAISAWRKVTATFRCFDFGMCMMCFLFFHPCPWSWEISSYDLGKATNPGQQTQGSIFVRRLPCFKVTMWVPSNTTMRAWSIAATPKRCGPTRPWRNWRSSDGTMP